MRASVLIADDDPGVRESLSAVLRSDGYPVLAARDGPEALALMETNDVDLVLLDLGMPSGSGWDIFERLTTRNPLLPIIIITARPDQWTMAIRAGVGALLEKPLDIPVLLQTMERLLQESPQTRLKRLTGRTSSFYFQPSTETSTLGDAAT